MPNYLDYSLGRSSSLYDQIAGLKDPFAGLTLGNFGQMFGVDPAAASKIAGRQRKQLGAEYDMASINSMLQRGGSATPGATNNALSVGKIGGLQRIGEAEGANQLDIQKYIANMLMGAKQFGAGFDLNKLGTAAGGHMNVGQLDLEKQKFEEEKKGPTFLEWFGQALGGLAPIAGALLAPATGGLSLGLGALGGAAGSMSTGLHPSAGSNAYSNQDMWKYLFGGGGIKR